MPQTKVRQRTTLISAPSPPSASSAVDTLLGKDGAQSEPLDVAEQEEVIREFVQLSTQQQRTWRPVFGIGSLLLAAFFLYAGVQQIREPFGVRYTGELRSVTGERAVAAVLLLQGAALALSAAGLLADMPQKGRQDVGCMPAALRSRLLLLLGMAGGLAGAVYWGGALTRMVQKHGYEHGAKWELVWLPLGPLAASGACVYVSSLLADTEKEILRLKAYRYNFKKL